MTVDEAKRMLELRFDRQLATWLGLKDGKSVSNYRRDGALPEGHAARVELHVLKAAQAAQATAASANAGV